MKRWIAVLMGLVLAAACATGNYGRTEGGGVIFETGKGRQAVMDAIIETAIDDGYAVGSTSDAEGTIVCNPRHMLDGVLTQKTSGKDWAMQSKPATLNHLIRFSARVGKDGVVELKTLVMLSGPEGPADPVRSEKLAGYYKEKILKLLHTQCPQPIPLRPGGSD